jgi:hypothetical protein
MDVGCLQPAGIRIPRVTTATTKKRSYDKFIPGGLVETVESTTMPETINREAWYSDGHASRYVAGGQSAALPSVQQEQALLGGSGQGGVSGLWARRRPQAGCWSRGGPRRRPQVRGRAPTGPKLVARPRAGRSKAGAGRGRR